MLRGSGVGLGVSSLGVKGLGVEGLGFTSRSTNPNSGLSYVGGVPRNL